MSLGKRKLSDLDDGYGIGAKVGAGAFGDVFEGTTPDGAPCALKRQPLRSDEGVEWGLLREVSHLQRLDGHPRWLPGDGAAPRAPRCRCLRQLIPLVGSQEEHQPKKVGLHWPFYAGNFFTLRTTCRFGKKAGIARSQDSSCPTARVPHRSCSYPRLCKLGTEALCRLHQEHFLIPAQFGDSSNIPVSESRK